jgi:ketosteroid isomerase-like protein
MRNPVLIVLLIILMPALIAAQTTTGAKVESSNAATERQLLETQLKTFYNQFLEAISQGDVETYAEMTTNQYVFTRRSNGEVLDKEQRLQQLKAEAEYIESFNITAARFSIYKNSAIGNFDLEEKDVFQGTEYNHLFRVTVSFVKTVNKGWKIAAVHSTPVSR